MTVIHVNDGDYNVKRAIEVDGMKVNVPNDCDGCGSFWTLADRGGGARYRSGGMWLCAACLQQRDTEPSL